MLEITELRRFTTLVAAYVISRMSWCCYSRSVQSVCRSQWRSQRRGRGARPPRLASQENSWLRRWAKYTKLCMVWLPNTFDNWCELSRGCALRTTHQGLCPWTPLGEPPFPRPPVPPTAKSWLRHWSVSVLVTTVSFAKIDEPIYGKAPNLLWSR